MYFTVQINIMALLLYGNASSDAHVRGNQVFDLNKYLTNVVTDQITDSTLTRAHLYMSVNLE